MSIFTSSLHLFWSRLTLYLLYHILYFFVNRFFNFFLRNFCQKFLSFNMFLIINSFQIYLSVLCSLINLSAMLFSPFLLLFLHGAFIIFLFFFYFYSPALYTTVYVPFSVFLPTCQSQSPDVFFPSSTTTFSIASHSSSVPS